MNPWLLATGALIVGGLGPATLLAARGDPLHRLLGLQLGAPVTVLILILIAQSEAQSGYLIVPLVLVLVGYAGTLIFTRLLGPRL